jgi:type II secretory pathway component GspD/PulD (secretin)
LMITYDVPSRSILVANASPSQLAEVEQLIKEFDKPARTDSVEIRQTAPIKIRYSKASVIAAAVKEVYRDLLSSRDKEFDRGGDQRQQRRSTTERVTVINYGGSSGSDSNDRASQLKVGFEGALSMGVDDVSNIIVVSAQKAIFDDVVRMIRELDQEAVPNTVVEVHRIGGSVSAAALQKAINEAMSKPWPGGKPEQEAGRGDRGNRGDRRRGEGDRGRNRRRGNDNDRDND